MACNLASAQSPEAVEDIRGPKAIVEIPKPPQFPIALWIGIGCGILALIAAWLLWRKLHNKNAGKSPSQLALASLAELELSGDQMLAENFANRSAQTIRQYIADQFYIAAPLRTTEEFLRELSVDNESPLAQQSDHLKSFLKSCDLAKFAGINLNSDSRHDLIRDARAFVSATAQSTLVSRAAKP
ncbi:MAG: hypothetical protein H8M99_10475 [Gloeobacteraceae cyanobacterium ES-bin-144]|nr:hypothetical protein [Verrucomicrobiales bacterium]